MSDGRDRDKRERALQDRRAERYNEELKEKIKREALERAKARAMKEGKAAYTKANDAAYNTGAEDKASWYQPAQYTDKSEDAYVSEAMAAAGIVQEGKKAVDSAKEVSDAKDAADGMSNTNKAALTKKGVETLTGQSVGTSLTGDSSGMNQATSGIDGAVAGGITGAQLSGGNPYAAAAGAVVGAVQGAASARAAAKAHNAKLEAQKHQALGRIEEEKGRNISNAIGQMGMRMSLR